MAGSHNGSGSASRFVRKSPIPTSKVEQNVQQVSAHKALKALQRGIRVRTDAARRALANVNPKAIERSTVIGISLFAASSIALQGFVVAQGNLSGRSAGVAQAAVVPHLNSIAPAAVATGRAELDPAELQPLKRGDRLELGAAGWQDDVRIDRKSVV